MVSVIYKQDINSCALNKKNRHYTLSVISTHNMLVKVLYCSASPLDTIVIYMFILLEPSGKMVVICKGLDGTCIYGRSAAAATGGDWVR